jgi:NodT family efflux transporter outer membrane factor (OMF) lipoprotein
MRGLGSKFATVARRYARKAAVFAGGIGLMHMLNACTLFGGDKPDPALDIPATYREAVRGKPHAAIPAPDWWRAFHSRELTALMEEAQYANLDIAAAVARVLQADANARIVGAPLLPDIEANPTVTRSRAANLAGGAANPDRTVYNASLSASYEIDFWGKNRARLLAAEETAIGQRYDREVVVLSTLASVGNAYFQVLGSQDRIAVARRDIAAASRILDLIRQRFAAGTAAQLDVAQQESLLATQRASVPPLEITLRQNIATLALLIGRPPERVEVRGGSMWQVAVPRITPGLPSELLLQRPDVREAEHRLASAHANVVAARAAFFPSIALTAQGGFQSLALSTLFGPGAAFYTAVASLTQPIFDGGLLLGQLDLAKGIREELLEDYRKSVISAFTDVDKALVAVRQNALRETLQAEAVRSARQAFQLSEQRLREGTIDLVTVFQTQQTLFQAEDLLAQVRLARLLAVITLYQAMGGGWSVQVEATVH